MLGLKRLDEHPRARARRSHRHRPRRASRGRLQAELGTRGSGSRSIRPADRATLGGILAGDASGPRRHLYGTARDLLIGVTVIGADGRAVHGGGKVVKNVAGYDLPKLFVGSYGTLGIW